MALTLERLHLCYQCGFKNVQKLTLSKSNGFQILSGSQGLIEILVFVLFLFSVLLFWFLVFSHQKKDITNLLRSEYLLLNICL